MTINTTIMLLRRTRKRFRAIIMRIRTLYKWNQLERLLLPVAALATCFKLLCMRTCAQKTPNKSIKLRSWFSKVLDNLALMSRQTVLSLQDGEDLSARQTVAIRRSGCLAALSNTVLHKPYGHKYIHGFCYALRLPLCYRKICSTRFSSRSSIPNARAHL